MGWLLFIVIGILTVIIIAIVGGLLYFNNLSTAKKELALTPSMRTEQEELEKEFTSKGYTLDNPNIIVDPYHNSPLTALVIFETEEEVG